MTRILTVGWSPDLISDLLPHNTDLEIQFVNALVDESVSMDLVRSRYRDLTFVDLGLESRAKLPEVNWPMLSSLEATGVPRIRTMIVGDPYLRTLDASLALRYVSHLAERLIALVEEYRPTAVLGSHDRIHSGIALAVARQRHVPFVALSFSTIPPGLVAFSKALNPNALVPIERVGQSVDLVGEARAIVRAMRRAPDQSLASGTAYVAPSSLVGYMRWWISGGMNFVRRTFGPSKKGIPPFSAPRVRDSLRHRLRRSWNRLNLPKRSFIHEPPSRPYVFHTLHLSPESTVDTWAPWFQDQLALVKLLAMSVPIDTDFVVKLHFSDPNNYSRSQLRELLRHRGILIADPDAPTSTLISNASLVTGITGTACLEAALLGKPVLMFGDSPYLNFPRTERAGRPADLAEQISHLLKLSKPSEDEVVEAYARYLSRFLPGMSNDWSLPRSASGLRNMAAAFGSLAKVLQDPDVVSKWYAIPPFSE